MMDNNQINQSNSVDTNQNTIVNNQNVQAVDNVNVSVSQNAQVVENENVSTSQNIPAVENANVSVPQNNSAENSTTDVNNVESSINSKKDKNNSSKTLIIVLIVLLILSIGGFVLYSNANKTEDNNNKVEENENQNGNEKENEVEVIPSDYEKTLLTNIYELAKNNKYIDTTFENKIDIIFSMEKGTMEEWYGLINNQLTYLKIEDGKLYLLSDYKYNSTDVKIYKSPVANFNEEIVTIKAAVGIGCVPGLQKIAVLTTNGNLYLIKENDNIANATSIMEALAKNEPVNLTYQKVNNDSVKISAFTKYTMDNRYDTCSNKPNLVYASDNTVRDYNMNIINNPIVDDFGLGSSILLYANNNIAINDGEYLKTKDNEILIPKQIYNSIAQSIDNAEYVNNFVIDQNDYLYYVDTSVKDVTKYELKLYVDSKVKDISKTAVGTNNIEVKFIFENGKNLIINVTGEDNIHNYTK